MLDRDIFTISHVPPHRKTNTTDFNSGADSQKLKAP